MSSVAPRYEPIIVTTLRRYVRRGAPAGLLQRLAGGPRDWRLLNDWWNVDGSGAGILLRAAGRRAIDLGDGVSGLSLGERRIAILQIADECHAVGAALPAATKLAPFFRVSRQCIVSDLAVLRDRGELAP